MPQKGSYSRPPRPRFHYIGWSLLFLRQIGIVRIDLCTTAPPLSIVTQMRIKCFLRPQNLVRSGLQFPRVNLFHMNTWKRQHPQNSCSSTRPVLEGNTASPPEFENLTRAQKKPQLVLLIRALGLACGCTVYTYPFLQRHIWEDNILIE